MASSLSKEQRNQLAKVTSAARAYAESAAKAALENLAVHESKPRSHMKDDAKKLRNRLRARGRALGDVLESDKSQGIARLIEMVAYENWHRLLFTRFLTENNLLITDKAHDSVPVTLADCEELAKDLGARDGQELACRFASALLPGVFRADDPALELRISIDDEIKLRNLLQDLNIDIFLASDSLGWTYQFWQADKKDKVNAGGNKIGADELPSVTQLFTEDYMVDFLLDNTLGAWWAGKVAEASTPASHKVAEASAPASASFKVAEPSTPASASFKVAEPSSLWSECTSEEECRKLASLPGCPWKYLRFIKMAEPSTSPSVSNKIAEPSTPNSVSNKIAEPSTPNSVSNKVAEASSLCAFFDKDEPIANQTGDLPHWRQPGVTYFVTFRCADSLPAEKLDAWQSELSARIAIHPEPHDDATKQEFSEKFPQQIQQWLDSGYGRCLLKNPAHQKLVQEALQHFNGTRYNLDKYIVAANHVHVLVTPCDGYELSEILHSWKSFTANKINEAEGLSGTFWQKESFDHIVRNEQTLKRFRNYIRDHDKHQRLEASDTSGKQNASYEDQRLEASATFNKNQRMEASANFNENQRLEFKPAAGTFDGWPKTAKELKCLDPCMGSGHFVVAMFERLVALRMAEEKLDEAAAVAAVIQDNLFGLEIDPRCTQIAAFNLALAAWRRVGHCKLPAMNLACSGLAPNAKLEDWLDIVAAASSISPEDQRLEASATSRKQNATDEDQRPEASATIKLSNGMTRLYELFKDAPILGSLINPRHTADNMYVADYHELQPLLEKALKIEEAGSLLKKGNQSLEGSATLHEMAVTARGLAKAAEILAGQFTLAITNVPYLVGQNQCDTLKEWAITNTNDAKGDLAYMFLSRMINWLAKNGSVAVVTPQNWLFQTSSKKFRERLLKNKKWNMVTRLGPGAFETIGGHVVNVAMTIISNASPNDDTKFTGLDVTSAETPSQKACQLRDENLAHSDGYKASSCGSIRIVAQAGQMANPDARITLTPPSTLLTLEPLVSCRLGLGTGDAPHYIRCFWEFPKIGGNWALFQNTSENSTAIGYDSVVAWDSELQRVYGMSAGERKQAHNQDYRGREVWGKRGVSISIMSSLRACDYSGQLFDKGVATIVPKNSKNLPALMAYLNSPAFPQDVRKLDQKVSVTNATLVKVPFDLAHWQKVAAEKYPHGLPQPFSSDPTQWLFNGHPNQKVAEASTPASVSNKVLDPSAPNSDSYKAAEPSSLWSSNKTQDDSTTLQVAVARLLGYQWPRQTGSSFPDCPALNPDGLEQFADADGIVCLQPLRGEQPAAHRLREILNHSFSEKGKASLDEKKLIGSSGLKGSKATNLEDWLRDEFFEQHCAVFHHRPFIWHIWDGRKDGFHALLNYHKLDHETLKKLTYSHLGDWIRQQNDNAKADKPGAAERLGAAEALQKELEFILKGQPPYDIFVRWKSLQQQAKGWHPDLNDGVRMNIRPLMLAMDMGKKGAGILRAKPNIKWDKDRGKEPERDKKEFPWFWCNDEPEEDPKPSSVFAGNRFNNVHLSLEFKAKGKKSN